MAISTVHKLDKIVLASGQEIQTIGSMRWVYGIQTLIGRAAGHVWPNFRGNQSQRPVLDFSTKQLDVLLTNCGIGGTVSLVDIDTYLKLATGTGNVARATTSHKRNRIALACVYWTSIRLPHNGPGEASVMIIPVYDGTNDPFVYTGSVALSGNLTATNYFGAGPVSINGTSVPGIQEINIESGIKLIELGDASEEFNTFVGIETGDPSVTIKTMQMVNWETLGLRGVALNGTTGLKFYGRKFKAGGSRIPNATAEHIYFNGINGTATPVDSSGNESSPVTDQLKVELISLTDSVVPLTGTVLTAIT